MKTIPPLERQEQEWLVQWLNLHPILKNFVVKIDNEGKRTPIQGFRLKKLGLRPGASDLFISYPTRACHGLYLEMKRNRVYTPSERTTPTWKSQEEFQEKMKSVGFAAFFCYGWLDGKRIVENYLEE